MQANPAPAATLVVDRTHLGRRASGIERITEDLFSDAALAPLRVEGLGAAGRLSIVMRQRIQAPVSALLRPSTLWVFPGYPPSPLFARLRERTVLYVHDLFLITRRADLNRSARLYMADAFRKAVERLRFFLVNSETTGRQLAAYTQPDARILPYRPAIRNVFGLEPSTDEAARPSRPLIVGALGTVEPRKNFGAAARICEALAALLGRPVELHVIGRPGWGGDHDALAAMPHVKLHGFVPDETARKLIQRFDLFLSTSHDEGLGLPLLEVQFAGIPVIAPDQDVFREVLGSSGTFIDTARVHDAAARIAALLGEEGWRGRHRAAAAANIARWNAQAGQDQEAVIAFLSELARTRAAA